MTARVLFGFDVEEFSRPQTWTLKPVLLRH